MKCVMCQEEIKEDIFGWGGGHNAEPVATGRCCADCNEVVVAVRLARVFSGGRFNDAR